MPRYPITGRSTYHEELLRMMTTDGLTGAYNRSYLLEFLQDEIARSLRSRPPLSLLMLDIDHLRAINDAYGYLTGDHVLREMTRRLRKPISGKRLLARYSGEEFAAVLPGTDLAGAQAFGEQIRGLIDDRAFVFGGTTLHVTISVGVAAMAGEDLDTEALIQRANDRLSQAKREGRNRVVG